MRGSKEYKTSISSSEKELEKIPTLSEKKADLFLTGAKTDAGKK